MKEASQAVGPFAIANFLAAFGGGLVLSMGLKSVTIYGASHNETILALLLGSCLSLLVSKFLPGAWKTSASRYFAWSAALVAATLLVSLPDGHQGAGPGLQAFLFALLCAHFSLIFLTRSLRLNAFAGDQMKMAFIDLAYYVGLILGLLTDFGAMQLLSVDIGSQALAGFIDGVAFSRLGSPTSTRDALPLLGASRWFARLCTTLTALTVGTQISLFSWVHQLRTATPPRIGPDRETALYVAMYAGAALAAITCASLRAALFWPEPTRFRTWIGTVKIGRVLPFWLMPLISFALLALVVTSRASGGLVALAVVVVSMMTYEASFLAVADHLGARAAATPESAGFFLANPLMAAVATTIYFGLDKVLDKQSVAFGPLMATMALSFLAIVGAMEVGIRRSK
jgi:hypothetical protein